jgi:Fe-S cluster assembly protein SufD
MPTLSAFAPDRATRTDAAERFAAASLPTAGEEVWRYSRVDEIDLERYAPVDAAAPVDSAMPPQLEEVLAAVGPRAGLVVTRNGRVARLELDDTLAGKGVALAVGNGDTAYDAPEVDAFVTLNAAFAAQPIVIDVPAGVVVDAPIVVLNWIDADGVITLPRTVIRAGEQSQLSVLEHGGSTDVDALVVPVSEVSVSPAANVRYLQTQDLGARVSQLAYATSRVDRDSFLEATAVALGGDFARLRTDAVVAGQGATSNLLAVYFGTETQMHDFRTLQDHVAPRSTSDLLFKGAVGGDARSVYSGLIRVRPGAHGTNAFQTNRNLVLSEGAHAESVPNLEIEENDVRCSHASAIGPVDEDQRYYLECRGVPSGVAERLIVLGFFDEIIERSPIAGLRPLLRAGVAAKVMESVG